MRIIKTITDHEADTGLKLRAIYICPIREVNQALFSIWALPDKFTPNQAMSFNLSMYDMELPAWGMKGIIWWENQSHSTWDNARMRWNHVIFDPEHILELYPPCEAEPRPIGIVPGHLRFDQGDYNGYIISDCYVRKATLFLDEGQQLLDFPNFYTSERSAEEDAYSLWLEKYGDGHEVSSHVEEMAIYTMWLKKYMPK